MGNCLPLLYFRRHGDDTEHLERRNTASEMTQRNHHQFNAQQQNYLQQQQQLAQAQLQRRNRSHPVSYIVIDL